MDTKQPKYNTKLIVLILLSAVFVLAVLVFAMFGGTSSSTETFAPPLNPSDAGHSSPAPLLPTKP